MAHSAKKPVSKTDTICALILVLLAALPRLIQLDLAEFKLDEANHYRMAHLLTRGSWRWVGSTASVGLPKPPLFVYTLAVPLVFTRDPRVAIGFLGVLAALAAGALYLILRRYLGKRAAFAAALLFALNPQAVLYARKLFTADLLPPLCTLFLAAALAFLASPRTRAGRAAAAATFSFALLALTTFSPLMLLPVLALLFIERRRDLRPLHWLGAAAVLAFPFVPYLITVAPHVSSALAAAGEEPSSMSLSALTAWWWELLHGSPWPARIASPSGIAAILLASLSVAGAALLLNEARTGRQGRWARLALTWLFAAPLFALALPVDVHAQYLVVLYPLLFLLPAAGVEAADRRSASLGRGALLLAVLVAAWQAWTWSDALRGAAAGVTGYGTPLGYWRRAAEKARDLAEENDAKEILVLAPGDQPWDEKANAFDALLSDTPHRIVDGYTTLVCPTHPALLLLAPEIEHAASSVPLCTEDLHVGIAASPLGGTYRYRLWEPTHVSATRCSETLIPASAGWASGVRLLGYAVTGTPQPGEALHVTLRWETTQGPLDEDVHWFNHLDDAQGHRCAQFDGVGWPASRWRPGDRVLVHYDLSIAGDTSPGPYVLRVGQYTYPEIANVPILDEAGEPAGDAVLLPIPPE
jgi:hypothetical protein